MGLDEIVHQPSNKYISSMQFCVDSSLILTPNTNHSFALSRNIRIRSSKLPPNFFNSPATYRYVPSPPQERPIATDISNRATHTPSFDCKKREAAVRGRQQKERKVETARASLEKTQNSDELIQGILSTSKKLRKVFRKQSLDFKESAFSLQAVEKQLRLPKIINRGFVKKY